MKQAHTMRLGVRSSLLLACATCQPVFGQACPTLTFERENYRVGNYPWAITSGDVNGDGYPDLVVANRDDNDISVLINTGDGSFLSEYRVAGSDYPERVALADLDLDGDLDLIVTNRTPNNFHIRFNDGLGGFAEPIA